MDKKHWNIQTSQSSRWETNGKKFESIDRYSWVHPLPPLSLFLSLPSLFPSLSPSFFILIFVSSFLYSFVRFVLTIYRNNLFRFASVFFFFRLPKKLFNHSKGKIKFRQGTLKIINCSVIRRSRNILFSLLSDESLKLFIIPINFSVSIIIITNEFDAVLTIYNKKKYRCLTNGNLTQA